MNPECCGKESKTSKRQSKASHPARKVACFCPPTMHDTKLDQLNKARVKGYSKYCQGRAHAKLLNQHVFKPYIWPDRLDIICLGRFSCTNQVTSVSLSVLCRQRMNISPVTQKKKKKKKKTSGLVTVKHLGQATILHTGAQLAMKGGCICRSSHTGTGTSAVNYTKTSLCIATMTKSKQHFEQRSSA